LCFGFVFLSVVLDLSADGCWVPGFDFIGRPETTQYLLWILGGLFLFVGLLFGIILRMALLMFGWRREIDKEHSVNAIAIASLATLKPDVRRNADDIRDLTNRISRIADRNRRLDRDEDDWGRDK